MSTQPVGVLSDHILEKLLNLVKSLNNCGTVFVPYEKVNPVNEFSFTGFFLFTFFEVCYFVPTHGLVPRNFFCKILFLQPVHYQALPFEDWLSQKSFLTFLT
jgi:hypothetical protein